MRTNELRHTSLSGHGSIFTKSNRQGIRLRALSCFLLLSCLAGAQFLDAKFLERIKPRSIGPAGMSGRVTAVDVDPLDEHHILAGTASGGLWESTDGGIRWKPIFDDMDVQAIGAVRFHPQNPSLIWVGTGEGNPRNSQNIGKGIYRSLDGGRTWKQMGLTETRQIHRILLHPQNPDIVYAGVLGNSWGDSKDRGLYKSTDGGKTWKQALYVNEKTGIAELVMDPVNPQKLIAATWEFRRQPWTFTSGGKGSGLYLSYDGGETWKKLGEKEGLPAGTLGRIGLAIAPGKPEVVYALIESKRTALYRSNDGGEKWSKVNDNDIGNRPFYYAEIYVDPFNENRVFNLYSSISRSEDGGRSFQNIYSNIHPDHHALWMSRKQPGYMINGNDGGLYISYDGGYQWRFAENLPVGQFYHVTVDEQFPYNIYGGLQDNGSWVGPSAVFKWGGIRNSEWKEVYFGDGFDVMPRKDDPRYVYAMSQGGELAYIDNLTGNSRGIRPVHPDGLFLRFNWNAALAQDPHSDKGIYYGSQFLHYSADLGRSWKLLSPDLTTNDTLKQKQARSGGLTKDATTAENHCSILAIAPSRFEKDVIWVGTDDGNLQLTRDGGKTWQLMNDKLPDLPQGAWIPYIELSPVNAEELFVVVNNYRQNDWLPYVYHSVNGGKSWKQLIDRDQVDGHCLSIVQDPVNPDLLFLGTEYGLYFSFDHGKRWQKWTKTFPSAPVSDMKIQNKQGDLVLATFGRSIFVLDQLELLREISLSAGKAEKSANLFESKPFHVFAPETAVLAESRTPDGMRFPANGVYAGENRSFSASFSYWLTPEAWKKPKEEGKKESGEGDKTGVETGKAPKGKKGGKKPQHEMKIVVVVTTTAGDTIRRFSQEPDSLISRINWNLRKDGIRFPGGWRKQEESEDLPSGMTVAPGTYVAYFTYQKYRDSARIQVIADPRTVFDSKAYALRQERMASFGRQVTLAYKALERLKEARESVGQVESGLTLAPDSVKTGITDAGKVVKDSIRKLMEIFMLPEDESGIDAVTVKLNNRIYDANGLIQDMEDPNETNVSHAVQDAEREIRKAIERINAFFGKEWKEYRDKAESLIIPRFRDYEPFPNGG